MLLDNLNHPRNQSVRRGLMNIMRQGDGAAAVNAVLEIDGALLDGIGGVVLPVQCVDVCVDDPVSQVPEDLQRLLVVGEVRGPHVGRELPDDPEEGVLEPGHLRGDAGGVHAREVAVVVAATGVSTTHVSRKVGNAGEASDRRHFATARTGVSYV